MSWEEGFSGFMLRDAGSDNNGQFTGEALFHIIRLIGAKRGNEIIPVMGQFSFPRHRAIN